MPGRRHSSVEGQTPPTRESARSQMTIQTAATSKASPDPTLATSHTPQSPTQTSGFRVPESAPAAPSQSYREVAKVAIPRSRTSIDAPRESSTRSGGRPRVTHACEPCRHGKTKCSGERPTCGRCEEFKVVCYYQGGKRDKAKM